MKTLSRLGITLALAYLATFATRAEAQDALTQARLLYDSASYDDALGALNDAGNAADLAEVEKYRALCLLALGRSKEAEKSLEHLAMTRPLFTLEGSDASPKLVALYQDVSKRTFPEASKQVYQSARASFDRGDMADASRQFKDVLALADQAPQEHAALMRELKMLSAGFLKLTEASEATSRAAASRNEPAAAPAAAPSASRVAAAREPAAAGNTGAARPSIERAPAPDSVYGPDDAAVHPPVSIERAIPPWQYRPDAFASLAFEGRIDVVLDEQGNVVDATMVKSINPAYDRILLAAARKWRFQPATLGASPVKYRVVYQLSVPPSKPK